MNMYTCQTIVLRMSLLLGFPSMGNPVKQAIASMRLFKIYQGNPVLLEEAKRKLASTRTEPSFAKRNNGHYEGVCMGLRKCTCGAAPWF